MFNKVYEVFTPKAGVYDYNTTEEVPLAAKVTMYFSKGKVSKTAVVALKVVPTELIKEALAYMVSNIQVNTAVSKATFYLGYKNDQLYSLHSFNPYGED